MDLYKDYPPSGGQRQGAKPDAVEWKASEASKRKGFSGRYARPVNTARSGATLRESRRKEANQFLGAGSVRFALFSNLR